MDVIAEANAFAPDLYQVDQAGQGYLPAPGDPHLSLEITGGSMADIIDALQRVLYQATMERLPSCQHLPDAFVESRVHTHAEAHTAVRLAIGVSKHGRVSVASDKLIEGVLIDHSMVNDDETAELRGLPGLTARMRHPRLAIVRRFSTQGLLDSRVAQLMARATDTAAAGYSPRTQAADEPGPMTD